MVIILQLLLLEKYRGPDLGDLNGRYGPVNTNDSDRSIMISAEKSNTYDVTTMFIWLFSSCVDIMLYLSNDSNKS